MNLFTKAHKMTREIAAKYEVNYQAQFTLCLNYLFENKGEIKMTDREQREEHLITVIGVTEKQAKYALDIREAMLEGFDELVAKVETIPVEDKNKENKTKAINNIIEAKELAIGRKNEWHFIQNKKVLYSDDRAKFVLEEIVRKHGQWI